MGGLAVASGAWGAHGLKQQLESMAIASQEVPDRLAMYETAVRYQMYHAGGLVLVGLLAAHHRSRWVHMAGWGFLTGVLLFSGPLFALVLGGPRTLVAVVPFGGLALIVGWVGLAAAGWSWGVRRPA